MRLEEVWIPVRDGVRLAADLYRPDDPNPVDRLPAILEYLPYRKDDGLFERTFDLYSYVVPHGYACIQVDIRGTGRSEGRYPDAEYTEQEQLDGEDVIAWLARQPWSNGAVGMWGISWGGFNAIQMAMRSPAPPALKAILAIDASDDMYQDDIHYIDGMLHLDEWVLMMDLANAMTRGPNFPLDEEALAARFDAEPWLPTWLRHQRDGPFWRRASLAPDYGRIGIPTFLIGGYYDGYRDSVPRMLQHLRAPVKAIVGPWNHTFPHDAVPGPAIEWRHEAVRWWDHWLKGIDNSVMDDPPFAVFVRRPYPPDPSLKEIPGKWRLEEGWPLQRTETRALFLHGDGSLSEDEPSTAVRGLRYVPSAGAEAGVWWGELTPDQRPLDELGLVFDSGPLDAPVEILGMPEAVLFGSADMPLIHWFVRLSDVAPNGSVTLVGGAGLNGAHRESATEPEAFEPGVEYPLRIDLHFTSWVFETGHRMRVAVSNALWPMIWPTPHAGSTELHLGPSHVVLPVVPFEERPVPAFLPPAPTVRPPGVSSKGSLTPSLWTVRRDEVRKVAIAEWEVAASTEYPWGTEHFVERMRFEVSDEDPAAASVHGEAVTDVRLADRTLTWRADLGIRSDPDAFDYRYTRMLAEGGTVLRSRTWTERIPRDFQ
jgi:uncharacterized protein